MVGIAMESVAMETQVVKKGLVKGRKSVTISQNVLDGTQTVKLSLSP